MDETTKKRSYSLNVQIAQLLDPEFDYEAESIANTERYRRLVQNYVSDLNAAFTLIEDDLNFELTRRTVDEWHVCYRQTYFAVAPTASGAICGAWLKYHTASEPSP